MDVPASTLTGLSRGNSTTAVWGRRAFLTLMLLFVIAGAVGLLGGRNATKSASADGYTLSLTYPRISRAGLDVPWQVTVTHVGGFSGPITLAVTGAYFDIFETQGVSPQTTQETSDGTTLYLTFNKPPNGDTFQATYDIYVQPSSQQGRSGTVSVLDHGQPTASVSYSTTLLP